MILPAGAGNPACIMRAPAAAHLHPWPVTEPAGQLLPVHSERAQAAGARQRRGKTFTAADDTAALQPAKVQHSQAAEVRAAGRTVAHAKRQWQVQLCEGCQCFQWRQVIAVQLQVVDGQLLQLAAGGNRGVHHEFKA
jgi:hypothetical protein